MITDENRGLHIALDSRITHASFTKGKGENMGCEHLYVDARRHGFHATMREIQYIADE
jgi:hypothetical protein